MYHADNPLHREILASFNDPDPDRALRFKPFVYGSRRHRLAVEAGLPSSSSLHPGERLRALVAAISRVLMPWRVECAPCCAPPLQ